MLLNFTGIVALQVKVANTAKGQNLEIGLGSYI